MTPIMSTVVLRAVYTNLFLVEEGATTDFGMDAAWCAFLAERFLVPHPGSPGSASGGPANANLASGDYRTACAVVDSVTAVKIPHIGHSYDKVKALRDSQHVVDRLPHLVVWPRHAANCPTVCVRKCGAHDLARSPGLRGVRRGLGGLEEQPATPLALHGAPTSSLSSQQPSARTMREKDQVLVQPPGPSAILLSPLALPPPLKRGQPHGPHKPGQHHPHNSNHSPSHVSSEKVLRAWTHPPRVYDPRLEATWCA